MRKNHLLEPALQVRLMLSRLSTVKANLRSGSEQEALERIYIFAAEDNGTENPPRIIVAASAVDWEWDVGFSGVCPVDIMVDYPAPREEQVSRATEFAWFSGQIQDLMDEIQESVRGGGELDLVGLSMEVDYVRDEELPAEHTERHLWVARGELRVQI